MPRGDAKRLAQLFDKLKSEARKLDSADTAENIYGFKLVRELTDGTNVRLGI